jgi:hypothetical protein
MCNFQRKTCLCIFIICVLGAGVLCKSSAVCGKICSCRRVDSSTDDIIVQCRNPNILTDIPDLKDEKKMLRVKEL